MGRPITNAIPHEDIRRDEIKTEPRSNKLSLALKCVLFGKEVLNICLLLEVQTLATRMRIGSGAAR